MREETETGGEERVHVEKWKTGTRDGTRGAAKCGASELDHTVGAGESCMSAALLPPLQTTEQWRGGVWGVDGEQLVS